MGELAQAVPESPVVSRVVDRLGDFGSYGPRLEALAVEFDAWQRFDNTLKLAERVPSAAEIAWPQVRRNAQRLIDTHPATEWARELAVAVERYEAAGEDTAREFALDDIRAVTGRQFLATGDELLELATTLREVASQIQAAVEVLVGAD
jgi:hypothetical protein